MTEIAIVGMGIAVPGASSPGEFWRLLNGEAPRFSAPNGYEWLDPSWPADPDAQDRAHVRVSRFLTWLRLHPQLASEIADGRFDRDDNEAVGLRHCLLQARDGVTVRDGDRGWCVIGGTGITSRKLDEAIVIESAAHHISARLRGGLAAQDDEADDDKARLRAALRHHFGYAETRPALLLPDQVVHAAISGLSPGDCPVTVVDTASSSALYALDLGARHLLAHDCEIAYCGGMSGVTPRCDAAFEQLGWLSRQGWVRVFDPGADGTVLSEAAAAVTLKTLSRAIEDGDPVLGVLAGFGASSDGRGRSICAASPAGQLLCIERAQLAAGIDASQVDWIVAHGTGTVAADAAELAALAAAAPGGRLCTSSKPVTGYTGWSAGAVSVIHALLALSHGCIPAHQGRSASSPDTPIGVRVEFPGQPRPWLPRPGQRRTVGVSAFGFGGTNSHLLIREHSTSARPPVAAPAPPPEPVVLVAWAAHLPGEPSRGEIEHMLSTGVWTCPRSFSQHEPPPFDEIGLAGTAWPADHGQLMALRLAARLIAEQGELWAPVRDTTGVIAAQAGPAPLAVGSLLRCYDAELTRLFNGADAQAAGAFLADVRAQAPPVSRDTLPGILPNILAARLANHYDLHGLTMLVDSGRTSGYSALDVAALYLVTGALDMALVLAVSVDVPAGLGRLAGAEPGTVAEGAFLLALTRASVARRHGWRVHAEIPRSPRAPSAPVRGSTSFLAADAVVSLLASLHRNRP